MPLLVFQLPEMPFPVSRNAESTAPQLCFTAFYIPLSIYLEVELLACQPPFLKNDIPGVGNLTFISVFSLALSYG